MRGWLPDLRPRVWGNSLNAQGPTGETYDELYHDCDGTPNNPPGVCGCQDGNTQNC
jgi:hypothetical protein